MSPEQSRQGKMRERIAAVYNNLPPYTEEELRGPLADDGDVQLDNTGVMAAMPIGSIQQDQLSRLGVRLDSAGHYLEQFERHAEYLLEMLMAATSRRDYLQEQVSKDAFWLDQFRECLRVFPAEWEIILKTLIERQANTQAMLEELMTFIAADDEVIGSGSVTAVQTRLSQIQKFVAGIKPPGNMEMAKPNDKESIREFLKAAMNGAREPKTEPKGRQLWTFTCPQCGAVPIEKVHGEQGWPEKLESGAVLETALYHVCGDDEEHIVEWCPF